MCIHDVVSRYTAVLIFCSTYALPLWMAKLSLLLASNANVNPSAGVELRPANRMYCCAPILLRLTQQLTVAIVVEPAADGIHVK